MWNYNRHCADAVGGLDRTYSQSNPSVSFSSWSILAHCSTQCQFKDKLVACIIVCWWYFSLWIMQIVCFCLGVSYCAGIFQSFWNSEFCPQSPNQHIYNKNSSSFVESLCYSLSEFLINAFVVSKAGQLYSRQWEFKKVLILPTALSQYITLSTYFTAYEKALRSSHTFRVDPIFLCGREESMFDKSCLLSLKQKSQFQVHSSSQYHTKHYNFITMTAILS